MLILAGTALWRGAPNEAVAQQRGSALPASLVYLRDVAPSIGQDIRYAGYNNFFGRPVPGYQAGECILHREAARRLAAVQGELRAKGFSLKVYDCYRPARAARAFIAWSRRRPASASERLVAQRFYPGLRRADLVSGGYISRNSTHPRGTTVDATLVALPAGLPAAGEPAEGVARFDINARYGPCTGTVARRAPDTGLDMGTGYDCFDAKSHTLSGAITPAQRRHRKLLVDVMARQGFRNYRREWWHFTALDMPGRMRSYDVIIAPRPHPPLPARPKSR